jgi:hypothetical protein
MWIVGRAEQGDPGARAILAAVQKLLGRAVVVTAKPIGGLPPLPAWRIFAVTATSSFEPTVAAGRWRAHRQFGCIAPRLAPARWFHPCPCVSAAERSAPISASLPVMRTFELIAINAPRSCYLFHSGHAVNPFRNILLYPVEGRQHRSGLLVHIEGAPRLDHDRAQASLIPVKSQRHAVALAAEGLHQFLRHLFRRVKAVSADANLRLWCIVRLPFVRQRAGRKTVAIDNEARRYVSILCAATVSSFAWCGW